MIDTSIYDDPNILVGDDDNSLLQNAEEGSSHQDNLIFPIDILATFYSSEVLARLQPCDRLINPVWLRLVELCHREAKIDEDARRLEFNVSLILAAWNSKRLMLLDPLEPLKDAGIITHARYQYTWALVERDWLFLEFTQVVEPYLKRLCRRINMNYPFNSYVELYINSLAPFLEDVASTLSCKYYEFSSKKTEQYLRTSLKLSPSLPDATKRKLLDKLKILDVNKNLYFSMTDEELFLHNPWITLTRLSAFTTTCQRVKDRLARYNHANISLNERAATLARNARSSSRLKAEKKSGAKVGGTYI